MEGERPVHVVLEGLSEGVVPLTNEEWAAHEERARVRTAEREELEERSAADRALVAERAAQDPAFGALVRLLGVNL